MSYVFKEGLDQHFFLYLQDGIDINVVRIDKEDQLKIMEFPYRWYVKEMEGELKVVTYASSKGKGFFVELSQLLLGVGHHRKIVHLNGDSLDYRKSNLVFE